MLWALNNHLFHDVVFVVTNDGEDQNEYRFFAHKVILCARSQYFKVMFSSGLKESWDKEIQVRHTNPKAFYILLNYLYTKNVNIFGPLHTPNVAIDFLIDTFSLTSRYNVKPLAYKLELMLSLNITMRSVCALLVLSHTYNATMLKSACCKYLLDHAYGVVELCGECDDYKQHLPLIRQIIRDWYASTRVNSTPSLACCLGAIYLDPTHCQAYLDVASKLPNGNYPITLFDGSTMTQKQLYLKVIDIDPLCAEAYLKLSSLLPEDGSITLLNGITMTYQQLLLKVIEINPAEYEAYYKLGLPVPTNGYVIPNVHKKEYFY